jgi:hypothetical protein
MPPKTDLGEEDLVTTFNPSLKGLLKTKREHHKPRIGNQARHGYLIHIPNEKSGSGLQRQQRASNDTAGIWKSVTECPWL